jgi:hypothetical protein
MGLTMKREISAGGVPVFQNNTENAMGGFALDVTGLATGATIPAGTVMGYDEATRKAKVLKVAKVQANAGNTATDVQVEKGHLVAVGDYLAAVIGGKAYAVTAIDTTNADYDKLTVGTTLGVALTAGDALFVSSATGASAALYATVAKGLLYQEVKVGENEPVAIAVRATVYERRIPIVTAAIKALLPNIIFSQSY